MKILDEKEIKTLKALLTERSKKYGRKKLRAAIYARKSAEDIRDTSLPMQIANCRDLIERYDFLEEYKVFQEDGVSGMFTDIRPQYLEMMELAEKREIDVIVVMKLDRLSRDVADASTAIKLISAYRCHLIAGDDVAETNTPSGEFMRNILLAQNQYYSRRVASDVIDAECKNARKGLTAGGIPPYGLKIIDKHFELNEKEAPAIKIMFERCAKGCSYKEIIDELDSLGFHTRAGNRFSYSSLNALLRNDKYYGTFVYNRIGGKKKKHRVLNEFFDEVRNECAIPPIITKKLFDKVQAKLDSRKGICRPRQNTSNFVLTGLLFCKDCGSPMSGATNTGGRNKEKYRRYICPKHIGRNGATCKTKPIRADYLENAVKSILTESINAYLTSADSTALFEGLEKSVQQKIGILSRRISDLENQIKSFLDKAANTSSSKLAERYEKQTEEYICSQEQKKADIAQLKSELQQIQNLKNDFRSHNRALTENEIFTSKEVTRELFHIFIRRIEIDDQNDDISIFFND